jgi:hypothetical protein
MNCWASTWFPEAEIRSQRESDCCIPLSFTGILISESPFTGKAGESIETNIQRTIVSHFNGPGTEKIFLIGDFV